jgi:hypothetical protein
MRNYRSGNGGHAPGHVRDMFLSAIESFEAWPTTRPNRWSISKCALNLAQSRSRGRAG